MGSGLEVQRMKPLRLAVLALAALARLAVSAEVNLSGRPLFEQTGSFGEIHAVAWSPDEKLVAIGTRGVHVLIVDAVSGNVVHALEGHFEDISSLAWRSDGRQLASGSLDGTVGI